MNDVGLLVLAVVLVAATAFGVWRRRTDGRLRATDAQAPERPTFPASDLGIALGQRATLVQFSSAFCAPCRATRVLLADIASRTPGVVTIEIDAEERLELTRRLNILRTPTVLVLDAEGRVTRRASGLPRRDQVMAALGEAVV